MKRYIISVGAALLPGIAFAQVAVSSLSTAYSSIAYIINNILFPILLAVAVFVVAWGIFKYILNAGDEEARKNGRAFILWGIVGIFLMLSIWGLVNILRNTFGLNNAYVVPSYVVSPSVTH